MKSAKKFPLIPVLIVVAVICFLGASYRWYSLREDGRTKIAETQVTLEKAKTEMLAAYKERIVFLESWQETLEKKLKKLPAELVLNENIKQAKDLKIDAQAEAERFDFVQNQVSEKIGQYMTHDPHAEQIHGMQKIEETINRKRKEYHRAAFAIEEINARLNLHDVLPIVFPAERILKQKGLF